MARTVSRRICLLALASGNGIFKIRSVRERKGIDGLGKVAGSNQQQVVVLCRQAVKLHESCVRRTMNVNRVGLEAEFGSIGEDGFYFVQEDEGRPLHGKFSDGDPKQFCDSLLSFPMSRAGKRVRLHFGVTQALPIEALGRARRQASGQRGFSRSGFSRNENDSVQRYDSAVNLWAQRK